MYKEITWASFKTSVINAGLAFDKVNNINGDYFLWTNQGVILECTLSSTEDKAEFDASYASIVRPKVFRGYREWALPKMARYSQMSSSSIATILIKVPGTLGVDKRYLKGAFGWFDSQTDGDIVRGWYTDEDNKLGGGAGAVIASFVDEDVPAANQGWWLPDDPKGLEMKGFEDLMELDAELYLKLQGEKASGDDTFRVNLYWGKR